MHSRKRSSRVVAASAVVVLLAAGGWLALKPDHKTSTTATSPITGQTTQTTATTKGADPSKLVVIETTDFKYEKPAGWAEISPKILQSNGSASGIGRPTEPVATFSVKVSNSVPKDSNDLKTNAINDIKNNAPNFALVSSVDTKVYGQAGQKFVYSFTDSSGKTKTTQQMSVIVYKNKTFFLLFSSAAADYDKQIGDFAKILAGFQFK